MFIYGLLSLTFYNKKSFAAAEAVGMWATRSVVQAVVELWVTLPLGGYP